MGLNILINILIRRQSDDMMSWCHDDISPVRYIHIRCDRERIRFSLSLSLSFSLQEFSVFLRRHRKSGLPTPPVNRFITGRLDFADTCVECAHFDRVLASRVAIPFRAMRDLPFHEIPARKTGLIGWRAITTVRLYHPFGNDVFACAFCRSLSRLPGDI